MQLWAKSSLSCSLHWQTFEQIEQEFGSATVPRMFKLLESQPVLLTHLLGQFHTLVLRGDLPRVLKEMVGLVVATATHCDPIRVALIDSLTQQYAEPEILAAIARGDYGAADVSHATRAVLRYADMAIVKRSGFHVLAKKRWHLRHQKSTRALDDTGLEEGEQLELMATIALFEQLCTVAKLLNLDPD